MNKERLQLSWKQRLPGRCYDNRSSYYAAIEVEDWRSERDLMMGEVGEEQRTMAMFCYPAGRKLETGDR